MCRRVCLRNDPIMGAGNQLFMEDYDSPDRDLPFLASPAGFFQSNRHPGFISLSLNKIRFPQITPSQASREQAGASNSNS
jgi:hypothetical protein